MEKTEKQKAKDERFGKAALFIPAGFLLGMGVGFIIENIPGGMFTGLGLGFLAFAIVALTAK